MLSVQTWNLNFILVALLIPETLSRLNNAVLQPLWLPSPNTPKPLPLAPVGTVAEEEIVDGYPPTGSMYVHAPLSNLYSTQAPSSTSK